MTILLVLILALLRTPSVLSSFNQTILYGYSIRGDEDGRKYRNSLHNLLGIFSSQASKTGFYNFSSTGRTPGDQLSGLYFCRGDIDQQQCRDCVNYAKQSIVAKWSYSKEGMFWYDHCMVRYSNKPFLGKLNLGAGFSSWNMGNITGDKAIFRQILTNRMRTLSMLAANGKAGRKFATRIMKFSDDETLYAMAQCSPDLSPADCYYCLSNAREGLRKMGYSNGGKVMRINCMIQYETFPFFYGNIKAMPITPVLKDTDKTMVHLRIRVDTLPFNESSMNSTSSNASSIMVNNATMMRFRAKFVIPPFSKEPIKFKLRFSTVALANLTVIDKEGVDQVDPIATE